MAFMTAHTTESLWIPDLDKRAEPSSKETEPKTESKHMERLISFWIC
jgi:hypothetical protein